MTTIAGASIRARRAWTERSARRAGAERATTREATTGLLLQDAGRPVLFNPGQVVAGELGLRIGRQIDQRQHRWALGNVGELLPGLIAGAGDVNPGVDASGFEQG